MKTNQETKVPKRVLAAIERMKGGERLICQHRMKATGEPEDTFFFEPSGGGLALLPQNRSSEAASLSRLAMGCSAPNSRRHG